MSVAETANFIERKACINCGGTDLVELSSGRFDQGAVQRFIADDPWSEHPAPFLRGKTWSFVSCKHCSLNFHRYILDAQWNERRFSKWMSQDAIAAFEKPLKTPGNIFSKAASHTAHVLQLERLTRALRGEQPLRVLDFGCGYGEFLSMCALFGFDAVGVDRSSAKRDNGSFARVFPEIDDVAPLAPFHVLTLFEVLEHLDDPRSLMLRLRDLLATNGVLVLETPDCSGVSRIETLDDYRKIHPLEHINAFTPESLKNFAARLGFEHIPKPPSVVASDLGKVVKKSAKAALQPFLKPTTQLYFRKTSGGA